MSITISQADQVKLARALVNPSKAVRDATCESLQSFLSSMKSMTDLEMLKLWKALYYCMWLSDKAVIQTEIASFLCDLIDSINKKSLILLYIQMFYHTMLREWPLLDQHRLDKFYKLMRFMLRKMFSYLHARQYPINFTRQCIDMLLSEVLSMTPNGIRFHLIDIYLQELALVSQGDIETNKFLILIQPFFDLLAHSRDEALHERINKKIFSLFLSKYAVENNTNMDSDDNNNNDSIFFSQVKTQSIQSRLFQTAADTNTHDNNRSKIYGLHKMFSTFTGIAFVAVEGEDGMNKESEEEEENIPITATATATIPTTSNKTSKKQTSSSSSTLSTSISKMTDKSSTGSANTTGKSKSITKEEDDEKEGSESVNSKISTTSKRNHVEFVNNHDNHDTSTNSNNNNKKKMKKSQDSNSSNSSHSDSDQLTNQSTAGSTPFRIHSHTQQQQQQQPSSVLNHDNNKNGSLIVEKNADAAVVTLPSAEFIASVRFQHYRPGYYFAKGKKGIGYYLDPRTATRANKIKGGKVFSSPPPQQQQPHSPVAIPVRPMTPTAATTATTAAADMTTTTGIKAPSPSDHKLNNSNNHNSNKNKNKNNQTVIDSDDKKSPLSVQKQQLQNGIKRSVSFGKPQAKDYTSSVRALQNSSPAKIMSESPRPRSALKKQSISSSSSSSSHKKKQQFNSP